ASDARAGTGEREPPGAAPRAGRSRRDLSRQGDHGPGTDPAGGVDHDPDLFDPAARFGASLSPSARVDNMRRFIGFRSRGRVARDDRERESAPRGAPSAPPVSALGSRSGGMRGTDGAGPL